MAEYVVLIRLYVVLVFTAIEYDHLIFSLEYITQIEVE